MRIYYAWGQFHIGWACAANMELSEGKINFQTKQYLVYYMYMFITICLCMKCTQFEIMHCSWATYQLNNMGTNGVQIIKTDHYLTY